MINQAFAERFFAGRNPIGMHITSIGLAAERTAYQVVGIAQNARTQSLRLNIEPRYFVAEEQDLSSVNMPTFDPYRCRKCPGIDGRAAGVPGARTLRCRLVLLIR